jgi:hypothetical protein
MTKQPNKPHVALFNDGDVLIIESPQTLEEKS